jgi:hypothetical protein
MLKKEKTPLLLAYTQKYLDKELIKQIELETAKLAEVVANSKINL